MPASLRVGVVGGVRLPGNVRTFLSNVERLLADHPTDFEWELLARREDVDQVDGFEIVDPGVRSTDRAIETIGTVTRTVSAYASDSRPDVLWQVTKFPIHGFATVFAGKRAGIPTLTRYAGDNFREYELSSGLDRARTFVLNNVIGRAPAKGATKTIVLGPHGRREIEKRAPGANVCQIPQPIDRDVFRSVSERRTRAIREELGVRPDERVLLSVGRLTHRKGMDDVARVARTLEHRDRPVSWYVVGAGPLREELEQAPNVELVGRVSQRRLVDYYRAADLLVHPSRIEGLPNVLLEAAACGLPSVARDVGDCSLAASTIFDETAAIPEIVFEDPDPVAIDELANPDRLRERYGDALLETYQRR